MGRSAKCLHHSPKEHWDTGGLVVLPILPLICSSLVKPLHFPVHVELSNTNNTYFYCKALTSAKAMKIFIHINKTNWWCLLEAKAYRKRTESI